jgi:hypothetical protein
MVSTGSPADDRREDELPAVGMPSAGRADELQAVEVRIGRRAHEPPDDLAALRVREIQVDREEIALGQERRRDVRRG